MFKNDREIYDTTLRDVEKGLSETIGNLVKARDKATGFEYVGLDSLVKQLSKQWFIINLIPPYIKDKPLEDLMS